MPVDADYLYTALLSYNYFPMVKENQDETPALFSSETFGEASANKLVAAFESLPAKHERQGAGFDQIEYRTTRFNNVARRMNIPTPMAYARLCCQLRESWDEEGLNRICGNPSSRIRPEQHEDGRAFRSDEYEDRFSGRVVIMGSEDGVTETEARIADSIGMFYFVEADISSCFPSIYTHALPWAMVGFAEAKARKNDRSAWFNRIDRFQRLLKRNETLGVPVGPATSNIACEVVLHPVDEAMREHGYIFSRHIDDYRAFCETRERAEEFIRDLERELAIYLLSLNAKKVRIEPLPRPNISTWILELRHRLPKTKRANQRAVTDYLDYAVGLHRLEPDGSVLKYATRAISGKLNESSKALFCQYALNLAVHTPVVLPILSEVVEGSGIQFDDDALAKVFARHIEYRRSDAVGWTAYLYLLTNASVPKEAAKAVVQSGDCMSMAALLALGEHEKLVATYVKSLDPTDLYCLDRYWMLLHELQLLELLPKDGRFDDYIQESGLGLLQEDEVSFLTTTGWDEANGLGEEVSLDEAEF